MALMRCAAVAEERPDEVALRDDRVGLSLGRGRRRAEPGRERPPRRSGSAPTDRARRVRRERGRDRARPPRRPARRRVDGAGQLPPQRRRAGLHPAATPAPRCCSSGPRRPRPGSTAAQQVGVPTGDRLALRARCDGRHAVGRLARRRRPPASRPPTCAPRPNLMYTSGTTGRPKGVELPPTMFAGGTTIAEHIEALAKNALRRASAPTSSSGRCTTPVRCRASGSWPPASRSWCSAASTPRACCRPSTPTRPRPA